MDQSRKYRQTIKNHENHSNRTNNKSENTEILDQDDWVCPVALALRKAGYNVPLRPSKSWLERDRKEQAIQRDHEMLLRKR